MPGTPSPCLGPSVAEDTGESDIGDRLFCCTLEVSDPKRAARNILVLTLEIIMPSMSVASECCLDYILSRHWIEQMEAQTRTASMTDAM